MATRKKKQVQQPFSITKLILFLVVIVIIYLGYLVYYPNKLPGNAPYQLIIDKNESIRSVAKKLDESGIVSSPRLMVALTRLMDKDKKVTAGLYLIKQPMSLLELIRRITNGKPDEISIKILEGWNFRQIRAYLNQQPHLLHMTESMTEDQIRDALKIPYSRMEGLLYPSTYFIAPNQPDLEVMRISYRLMQNKLADLWVNKNKNATNYQDPYQLLVMASLIQKETSDKDDMYQISTVFNNRLRTNMRLQDDPAVFYGLNNKATITRADFKIDTPYNTYLHNGLPPTPICTPSQSALAAAANPGDDYKLLYFVAIGNGKTKFSYTYDEHSQAVNQYLKKPEPVKSTKK